MELVKATNLTKVYGEYKVENATKALNGVSLQVQAGEFIGVMGPSGSGKSTLVNILSGITAPTTGAVEIEGKEINQMDQDEMAVFRRRKLGFVFQDFNLLEHLTVKENIMLPMVLEKRPKEEMEQKASAIMKQFGIEHLENKYPYNISGGQQQRVAVSRALINDPILVFADEPTGNLDSKSANAVMNCFSDINEQNKATILMVTHDVFAASFCKKIIFIKDGQIAMEIVRKGTRKEFFDYILDCQAMIGGVSNDL
ncbi:MAG: ABC transporter ATP-binding protein [bacterium]|nr:ABC transporter ATP-binding protein [bacterium]